MYHPRHKRQVSHATTRRVATGIAVAGMAGGSALFTAQSASADGSLTPAQVTAIAKAGCPQLGGQSLDTAVRITGAESGRNPSAHNTNGEDSRGLWQINVAAHGSPWGNLFDPVTNARAMCDISDGGSHWGDWTTFVSGAYLNNSGAVFGASAPVQRPPQAPVHSSGDTYTVRQGDWLMKIARSHGVDWRELYNLNRGVIGYDPNKIQPGQVLTLPS